MKGRRESEVEVESEKVKVVLMDEGRSKEMSGRLCVMIQLGGMCKPTKKSTKTSRVQHTQSTIQLRGTECRRSSAEKLQIYRLQRPLIRYWREEEGLFYPPTIQETQWSDEDPELTVDSLIQHKFIPLYSDTSSSSLGNGLDSILSK